MFPVFLQDTDEVMMAFSYEWRQHPVLYDTATRLGIQAKGNAAMCLAIHQAKEELSEALGMDGVCVFGPLRRAAQYRRTFAQHSRKLTTHKCVYCACSG